MCRYKEIGMYGICTPIDVLLFKPVTVNCTIAYINNAISVFTNQNFREGVRV